MVPVRSIVATSQGRRRRRGRAGARLALLALAPRRRPGRHPGGPRPRRSRRRPGRPLWPLCPPTAPGPCWDRPSGPTGCRTGGCTRGGWSAWPPPGRCDPHRGRPHPRAGRRRPAGPDRGPHHCSPPARASGFLVGAGGGRLDHRAAAMVQGASGEGGGILCTYEADGRVGFREHTDEARQFAYAPSPAPSTPASPAPGPGGGRRAGPGADPARPRPLPAAPHRHRRRRGDAGRRPPRRGRRRRPDRRDRARVVVKGGHGGARHWFAGLGTAGAKVARRPERAEGPSSAPSTPSTGRC